MKHRPDIDGLRALAILAVILYHAKLGFPGGFVGVDVFFVISGYLIFSIIYKEAEAGTFSILAFLERRIRRIFPAMLAMTMIVFVCGWFLLLPEAYKSLSMSTIAAMTVWANFYFWQSTQGYFTPSTEELPLLHTWSLSIEEQFYILLPIILIAAIRWRQFLRPRLMMTGMVLMGISSLICSVAAVKFFPSAAFFFLPSRAWEFLLGSLIAFVPRDSLPRGKWGAQLVDILGLSLILIPCIIYTESTQFPGLAALPPCLGTAILILNGKDKDVFSNQLNSDQLTLVRHLISSSPLVFIGAVSYSWYLWHWPVLAFAHYWILEGVTLGWRIALVGLSFIIAVLSWRYIEQPVRRREIFRKRSVLFSFALLSLLATIGASILVIITDGYPMRLPEKALFYAASESDIPTNYHIKTNDIRAGKLPHFGIEKKRPSILLWGDSQAYCLIPAFDEMNKKMGVAGVAISHGSRAPVLDGLTGAEFGRGEDLSEWGKETVKFINDHGIKYTFLAGFWQEYINSCDKEKFIESMIATIKSINGAGSNVFILKQIPSHQIPTPRDLVKKEMFAQAQQIENPVMPGYLEQKRVLNTLADSTKDLKVAFLDPTPLFYNEEKNQYLVEKNGQALYYDTIHINETTSRQVIAPWLESQFYKKRL